MRLTILALMLCTATTWAVPEKIIPAESAKRVRDLARLSPTQVSNVVAAVRCNYDALQPPAAGKWASVSNDCLASATNAAQNRKILVDLTARCSEAAAAERKQAKQMEDLTEGYKTLLRTAFPELWRQVKP